MQERDIDLMFLPRAANIFYLTGIRRLLEHGTDHNAYVDWLSGGYFGPDALVEMVAPRMGGAFWVNEAEGNRWIREFGLILEPIPPLQALRETLARFGITG